jgi:tape measure domain-containing protein
MAEQKLRYVITGDATQLNGALNRASVRLKAFGQAASRVGKSLSIGLTAPITIAGTVAVNQAVKFEKLRTTLNVLTGSADEGARAFERLVQFSAKTPFQLPDLVAVNNTLMGFGLSADNAFENLKKLGDIAGITGGNLNNIAIAFGQAAAEGRVMTRDLRQFINNGVPVIKILAQEMGVAEGEIMDLATQGKITFDVLEKAFTKATASGGDFAGGTKILSQTLGGLLSTLKDNVNIALSEFGQAIAEAFNLSENIPKIAARLKDLTDKFRDLSPATQKTIILFTAAVAGIGPLLIIIGKLSVGLGAVLSILPKVRVAFVALTTAMKANPFILVATAIAGVVLALQNMKKATDAAKLEAFGEDLKKLSVDEAETKLAKLNKTFKANKEILDENNKLGLTRRKFLLKDADGVQRKTQEIQKENNVAGEQIKLLEDFIKLKKEEQTLQTKPDSPAQATTTTTTTSGPTPEEIAQETADALLTTKKKQFDAEISATKAHYNKLIELNKGNDEQIKQLEISKGEKLKEISNGYYSDLFKSFEDYATKRSDLQTKIEDASAVTDEQRKALEIQRTQEFYGQLIEQAKLFHLDFSALQDAMTLKIQEITNGMTETTSNFKSSQENINSVLQGSFSSLGNSIANTFGASQSILGGFLQTFISTAVSIMAANNAAASADAIKAGTQTSLSFGPAASFVLPALVAASLGVVAKSFGSIKKFAKGGIVSTPTMGMFGEYPGARSNPEVVAPLDRLRSMIGDNGGGKVQVGGEFTLRGQDLVVALQRANRNRDRIN